MHRLMPALRMVAFALLAIANFAFRLFGARDYMLFAGLGLMAYGLKLVYEPAAYIAPGVVLAAVAVAISFKGAN
ncbi:hypothetical protein [Rhizobium sp. BK112]|nr:hypothetical protein [Rhizobium sp. BK112]MBB3297887.1 hypothetical protein [Rhizobium sp. BK112]